MPNVESRVGTDGLPCVAWTDSEYHPDDLIVWLGALAGCVLGFVLSGWIAAIFTTLAGFAATSAAHRGFMKFRTRQRQCWLVRTPKGLLFVAQPDSRSPHQNVLPYPELTGFALVTASEWFDRRRDRSQETVDSVDPLVVLAQLRNGAHMVLASHVGSQQEMSVLHVELTDAFIAKRHLWK
jgi:hypothetical protein